MLRKKVAYIIIIVIIIKTKKDSNLRGNGTSNLFLPKHFINLQGLYGISASMCV